MSRKRRLSPEERALWERIAATAKPARPAKPAFSGETEPFSSPLTNTKPPRPALAPFGLGQRARHKPAPHNLAPSVSEQFAAQPVQMDRKAHKHMTRGRLKPEAVLDLHGMTIAEAHPELIRFILNAQSHGKRLVLVITGKGKNADDHGPIPQRTGVLRHQLPH